MPLVLQESILTFSQTQKNCFHSIATYFQIFLITSLKALHFDLNTFFNFPASKLGSVPLSGAPLLTHYLEAWQTWFSSVLFGRIGSAGRPGQTLFGSQM